MNNRLNKLRTIEYNIQLLRLEHEIEYEHTQIEKNAPKAVAKNENFFSKIGKNTMNALKKNGFANHNDSLNKCKEVKEDILNDANKEGIKIFENKEELKNAIEDLFQEDKFGIGKLELEMNIVLDHTFDYCQNDVSFKELSLMFSKNENEIKSLFNDMQEGYVTILNDKSETLKTAMLVGGISTLPFLIGGTISLIGGVGIGMAILGMSLGASLAGGAIGGVTYMTLNEAQKYDLRMCFNNLTVEESAVSLVRTIMSLKQINKFYDDKEGKRIYDNYIDNYIDLKSDLDLRLFMEKENVSVNSKKNDMFHNSDKYLKKVLNLNK